MCGSNVSHSNDPTCGLNGDIPNGSPLGEFPSCIRLLVSRIFGYMNW
jgi:hypothetical protein